MISWIDGQYPKTSSNFWRNPNAAISVWPSHIRLGSIWWNSTNLESPSNTMFLSMLGVISCYSLPSITFDFYIWWINSIIYKYTEKTIKYPQRGSILIHSRSLDSYYFNPLINWAADWCCWGLYILALGWSAV